MFLASASYLGALLVDGIIIFCPVVGYIPQYQIIKKNQSLGGFSKKVCLILLLSQIMRIMFWFGREFEFALLLQSIVMIIAQLLLLRLCVQVESMNLAQSKHSSFSSRTTLTFTTFATSS